MEADNLLFIVLTVVSSVGRGGMVVFGLSSWLGKVWANRILESDRRRYSEEIDRLRHELEKTLHVHRIQFETEFASLSEIWRKVARVRQTMGVCHSRARLINTLSSVANLTE